MQELATLEMEKGRKKDLDCIQIMREEIAKWWEKTPNQLDLAQTTFLIRVLKDLRKELRSQHFQTIVPQNYYGGSYNNNNIVGGDVNAFNSNPNMIISNHGPMFGYNNNKNVFELFDPNYNMKWSEYNYGQY